MGYQKTLRILIVIMALNLPAFADRGSSVYRQGVHAERLSKFDDAYGFYKEAYTRVPNNAKYFVAFTRTRFKAASQHVHNGQLLRNVGKLQEALAEFQRAVQIDASNPMAQQEFRITTEMISRREKQASAPKPPSQLRKMVEDVGEAVELQPISTGPITFKVSANADVVYRTLCKLAGINVLIDPDFHPQKITVDLNNVTLLQALDMLRLQSKTYWRPVLPNTIFVTSDTPAKRKDLEQNVMKTFYLQNLSSTTELQEAANVVSKLLDVSRVQLLQGQDALVVRGTMDQLVLVDKMLTDIDKPKSEVVIDVAVMEVSRTLLRNIGVTLPTSAAVTYIPGTSGSGSSGSGYTFTVGSFGFSVPGATATALESDTDSKVLQNPQIRVLNDEKATLRIGDRVPIATGSFASGLVGGGSVSPLISTQFQYLDVGVNIDITPHIHANHEVTLKLGLEISTVTGEQNIGGITQPIIGQRRIEHETRLADGDVNLIGGILEDSEQVSLSGYPWISKLPLLKYLFGQDNKQRNESEIVFAITPHIIRAPEITEDNLRIVEVGTGGATELHHKLPVSAPSTSEQPASQTAPATPAPAAVPPAAAPSTEPPAPAPAPSSPGSAR